MKPYLSIIEYFGTHAQMKKLHEETFEFLEAVDNYEDALLEQDKNCGCIGAGEVRMFREHVIEEMGDLLLMLTQFIALYKIDKEEIDEYMDYKLKRTLKYIEIAKEKEREYES